MKGLLNAYLIISVMQIMSDSNDGVTVLGFRVTCHIMCLVNWFHLLEVNKV